MTRKIMASDKIALLATGDEISNGDILNSNSQEISQRLFKHGMHVGMHMTTRDNIDEIEAAMHFLLQSHRALIITGGLGPTSDDLTRYALSKVLNSPLLFNQTVWHAICARFNQLGYPTPPDNNRQQALFPENTTIIPNSHGTAAGCIAEYHQQPIFMLPGPPIECLPMVDQIVLPHLLQYGFRQTFYYDTWLLFGVSEGKIAEELDAIAKPFQCTTGYRLCYPYLEFKLYSKHQSDFNALVPLIQQAIAPHLIADGKHTASELLQKKLIEHRTPLMIYDSATGGLLEATIKTPHNYTQLIFSAENPMIIIKGLDDFWRENHNVMKTHLEIILPNDHIKINIPFRGSRVKQYAVEFICQKILAFLVTVQ